MKAHWPHAPLHRLSDSGTYFVTASTYLKGHHFSGATRLGVLNRGLLKLTFEHGWRVEAWAVFSNHYHFVAHSPADAHDASSLLSILTELHARTARWVNMLDETPGRKVWYNYRETELTHQRSYFSRLNYVHQNPVKHGLVTHSADYPWCSARWLEQSVSQTMVKRLYAFKTDRLKVTDDYTPHPDW